jgi:hypothetical protein
MLFLPHCSRGDWTTVGAEPGRIILAHDPEKLQTFRTRLRHGPQDSRCYFAATRRAAFQKKQAALRPERLAPYVRPASLAISAQRSKLAERGFAFARNRRASGRRHIMRIFATAILFAALATPAFAQSSLSGGSSSPAPLTNLGSDIGHPKSLDEFNRQQEGEKSYKAGLKQIPDQKGNDPWGNVRTDPKANQAKAPANPKKPKTD